MSHEREGYRGAGPNTKGGGFRGGPKRWTGQGPRPARHIPWPEIFKHHISLIEGHLKMTDMVRKHTVEGTGNWRTICDIIDRTKEMLHVAKSTSRTFVPPPTLRDQVPIGSSSASMYPGYSPADHEYGKAAEEYGQFVAAARDQGVEITHPDAEYEIGQARGVKRKKLEEIRATKEVPYGGPGSKGAGAAPGTRVAKPLTPYGTKIETPEGKRENTIKEAATNGDSPFFVIDVNPTPVNIPGVTTKSPKRSATPLEPHEQGQNPKKAKQKHDGVLPGATDDTVKSPQRNVTPPESHGQETTPKKAKRKHDGVLSEVIDVANKSPNRSATPLEPHEQGQRPKKAKQKHDGILPGATDDAIKSPQRNVTPPESHEQETTPEKAKRKHDSILFEVIDVANKSPNRSTTPLEAHEQGQRSKKAKQKHDGVLPGATDNTIKSPKRNFTPPESHEQETKSKKAKKKHDGVRPPGIEFEDISEEVDARMKTKEAKRNRRKEEKKRKRDSGDLSAAQAESSAAGTAADNGVEVEMPMKKKKKSAKSDGRAR